MLLSFFKEIDIVFFLKFWIILRKIKGGVCFIIILVTVSSIILKYLDLLYLVNIENIYFWLIERR